MLGTVMICLAYLHLHIQKRDNPVFDRHLQGRTINRTFEFISYFILMSQLHNKF